MQNIAGHNRQVHQNNNAGGNSTPLKITPLAANAKSRKHRNAAGKPNEFPLDGACLTKSIINRATVTTTNDNNPSTETYIGLTKNEFNPSRPSQFISI